MIRRASFLPILIGLALPAGAFGASPIAVPAGPLRNAVEALSRQAGVTIAVTDAALWQRRVAAVNGRMSPRSALDRMLRGTGAEVVMLDGRTFRIGRARPAPPRHRPPAARPVLPPPADDIVITGSKRGATMRDYAGTASVIAGQDLGIGGERGTESILARVATLSSTHLGAGRNKLFIRGIADSSFTGPTQATVGQYVGDIRLAYNAPDPDLRLYDIAAVEVLEGPQGTLYGAGSLGGIIRVVRNPPRPGETEGSASAGFSATRHGAPGGDIGGMANLPIGGNVALRLVGYGIVEGGYIDDVRRGLTDVNRTTIAGGRAMLRLDPGGGWTIDLGGTVQRTRGDDSQYADRDSPPLTRASALAQGFSADYQLFEATIARTWDSGIRFQSSTGLVDQTLSERYDASDAANPARLFRQHNVTRLISSESRVWRPMRDGLGWVLGASVVHNSTRLTRTLGSPDMPMPLTGVVNDITEMTAYGEGSWAPTAGVTLTVGSRLSHSRLSGAGEDVSPARLAAAAAFTTADRVETAVLPSLGITVAALPGLSAYARYQEGFRPGGLAIEGDFVRRFQSDHVATIETGLRHGAPGRGAFDASISFSYTRWRNIQADFIDGDGLPSTANIGDGEIWSLSAKAAWRPLPGFSLDASVAHNDSAVTDTSQALVLALATLRAGDPVSSTALVETRTSQVPNVAEWAGRLGFDYRTPLRGTLNLRAGGAIRYIGESRLGIGPRLGDPQGDYFDTALFVRLSRGRLGLSVSVTNIADVVGNRFALGTPFAAASRDQITPLRPRTFRIGIDTEF